MKTVFARRLGVFLLGFLLFFLLRLGYGYVAQPNGVELPRYNQGLNFSSFEISRKNYAGQNKSLSKAGPLSIDQRYEKVATLGLTSEKFEDDEEKLREIAKNAEALIQYEQAYGLSGGRQLQMALGVHPDRFDSVIEQIRTLGRSVSFQVNKSDKTNEYRELLARQESLRKSRDNLLALKSREADLRDLIALENQILELESQIQSLGVSVGEFDSEYEFVTIKLTMSEVPKTVLRDISFVSRAKVALEWAVKYYLALVAAFLMFAIAAFLGAITIRWGRKLQEQVAAK